METQKLIKEDKILLNKIISDLRNYKPLLEKFKDAYNSLELGTLKNSTFKIIVLTGTDKTIDDYINSLNIQLDKLGVSSKVMRENLIKNHSEVIENFKEVVQDLKDFKPNSFGTSRPFLSLQYISFDEVKNDFIVSEVDKEGLLEKFCRIYIDAKYLPQIEVIKKLETSFNEFLEILDSQNLPFSDKLTTLNLVFNLDNYGTAYIEPDKLKGLLTYKERFEAHHKRKLTFK